MTETTLPADEPATTPRQPDAGPADPLKLLDIHAVANILGCCERHVRDLVAEGHLPEPIRVGRLVRWSRDTIAAWIARGGKPALAAGGDR